MERFKESTLMCMHKERHNCSDVIKKCMKLGKLLVVLVQINVMYDQY